MSATVAVPMDPLLRHPDYPNPAKLTLIEDEQGWSYVAPSQWRIVTSYSAYTAWNLLKAWARDNGRTLDETGCAVVEVAL